MRSSQLRNIGVIGVIGYLGCGAIFAACSGASTGDESVAVGSSELKKPDKGCDKKPTGVTSDDYWLDFTVPAGLMPDPKFDGRAARLRVHRVQPVYASGKCPSVRTSAAVLIHGRTGAGPVAFDHRRTSADAGEGSDEGELSVQENLALAGIDTFAPSLLGYGESTRFPDGLDDPCNASTTGDVIFPPQSANQQQLLIPNPLASPCPHSTPTRFARVDVWVRDVSQVVDDAIARAQPEGGKITLVGFSAGAGRVGRALYHSERFADILEDDIERVREKTERVVFIAPLLLGPDEEPAGPFPNFPLGLAAKPTDAIWKLPDPNREALCTGRVIPGTPDEQWDQILALDDIGRGWGGDGGPGTAGLNRFPTFSTYGFNPDAATKMDRPVLVIQGVDDTQATPGPTRAFFANLPVDDKVLVELDCASHSLLIEGCAGERCERQGQPAYGTKGHEPWPGPHRTVQTALIEWIEDGKFDHKRRGEFVVDLAGRVSKNRDGGSD